MKISLRGLSLIKKFEGLRLKPYLCAAGIPTIGYGCIQYPDGRKVTTKDPAITEQQATDYLEYEVNLKTQGVATCIKVPLNQNEIDALISLAYNIGNKALQNSTLLKMLNAGDKVGAAAQFLRWNKAGGKELPGLTKRRQQEKDLFVEPVAAQPAPKTNQLPDGPSESEIDVTLEDIENQIIKPK
jgi:lysozyme